jgi:hypothetical protein
MKLRRPSIALSFRGFDMHPEQVEQLVGLKAERRGIKGQLRMPNRDVTWPRSFVRYELSFEQHCFIRDRIPRLLEYLGGIEHIAKVRQLVQPEFLEIDLALPIKGSDEQDDGYFPLEVLQQVTQIGASIGLSFLWNEGFSERVIKFLEGAPTDDEASE